MIFKAAKLLGRPHHNTLWLDTMSGRSSKTTKQLYVAQLAKPLLLCLLVSCSALPLYCSISLPCFAALSMSAVGCSSFYVTTSSHNI